MTRHCTTCGDEGIRMQVLDVDEATGLARCKTADGAGVEVETELVGPVRRGDAVLVHAGTALVLLDEECR